MTLDELVAEAGVPAHEIYRVSPGVHDHLPGYMLVYRIVGDGIYIGTPGMTWDERCKLSTEAMLHSSIARRLLV